MPPSGWKDDAPEGDAGPAHELRAEALEAAAAAAHELREEAVLRRLKSFLRLPVPTREFLEPTRELREPEAGDAVAGEAVTATTLIGRPEAEFPDAPPQLSESGRSRCNCPPPGFCRYRYEGHNLSTYLPGMSPDYRGR